MKEKISLFLKEKKILIILVLVSGLILFWVGIKIKGRGKETIKKEEKKQKILLQEETIPTISPDVLISLTSIDKKEVILTIENIPSGTQIIDYELSYLTGDNLPKGVIGSIEITNQSKVQRKITLGTCSSGSCVYDQGVEKIEVNLKFSGSYGERIFQKEFKI